jgi:uncharacterized protein YukE
MENPDRIRTVDHEGAEAEAQAALIKRERDRIAMSAREFVSERDALEDAWNGSGEHAARDEGW